MKIKTYFSPVLVFFGLVSCISTRKYDELILSRERLEIALEKSKKETRELQKEHSLLKIELKNRELEAIELQKMLVKSKKSNSEESTMIALCERERSILASSLDSARNRINSLQLSFQVLESDYIQLLANEKNRPPKK